MNFKARLTFLFVGLFLVVLSLILAFIYVFYADFRRDEFFERLRQKCETTARLLVEVNEVDKDLLKIIDQNSINKMYDEKILVFDENNKLIYSSLDDETIPYSSTLINQIRNNEEKFYVDDDGDEVVGIHYTKQDRNYVVLGSAYDTYGFNKMKNLKNLLTGAMALGTILIALSSYFYMRQVFKPIDTLNQSIQSINENNLKGFITVKRNRDELDKLAHNYNGMLQRLSQAFDSQRSFVRNASHELKTPLALMMGRVEKLGEMIGRSQDEKQQLINSILEDVKGQASLIESLLLLQRLQSQMPVPTTDVRVDEILYESIRDVSLHFNQQKVEVDIDSSIQSESQLIVQGNVMLLKTCFRNMVENAALYSSDNLLSVRISADENSLQALFQNSGEESLPSQIIFEPFYRSTKEQEKPGNGLGLSIVKQIISMMNGSVEYFFEGKKHCFRLIFPHR